MGESQQGITFQLEQPEFEDLFGGKGHQAAADAIQSVIESQPEVHIIGLEGQLGAGKSTVINLLKSKINTARYPFITFDVEQYHHASTKASFIKVFSSSLMEVVDANSKKKILAARDKALGNILNYTKNTNSYLSPSVLVLGLTVVLCGRYGSEALDYSWVIFDSFRDVNFELESKNLVNLFLGFSPLIFLGGRWLISKLSFGRLTFDGLGNLLKRNSEDRISERLEVTREVGSIELMEACKDFSSTIPEDKSVILIIDNLDRVEPEKVREVWSDLEIFTSLANHKIKILLPFSEGHVASSLSNDGSDDGYEFISKRLPVVFRAPPIVSAGWRELFKKLWQESLPSFGGEDVCSDLLDIWFDNGKKITPRFLKKYINDIASILMTSQSADVSSASCAAYLNVCRYEKLDIKRLLSSNERDDECSPTDKKIYSTQKQLNKKLTQDDWASQIACIHFQTNEDTAKSELLADPIKSAIKNRNGGAILDLMGVYGFSIFFERELELILTEDAIVVARSILAVKGPDSLAWLNEWLPIINVKSRAEGVIENFNEDYIKAIRILLDNNLDVDTTKITLTIDDINDTYCNEESIKDYILSHLYSYCEVTQVKPSMIFYPKMKILADNLWPNREKFEDWDIYSICKGLGDEERSELIEYLSISAVDEQEPTDLLRLLMASNKIGSIDFNDRTNSPSRGIKLNLRELSDDDFCLLPYSLAWFDENSAFPLIEHLEKNIEESQDPGRWVAVVLAHLVVTESATKTIQRRKPTGQVYNSNALKEFRPYLNKFPELEDSLHEFLVFSPSFKIIIDALNISDFKDVISKSIKMLILNRKVHSLNISDVFENYSLFDDIFLTDKNDFLNWLFSWSRFIKIKSQSYPEKFIADIVENKNSQWLEFIVKDFDSNENGSDYWLNEIKEPRQNTVEIVGYLINKSKSISNSKSLGVALESYSNCSSNQDSVDFVNSEWVAKLMGILRSNSKSKLVRLLQIKLIEQSTNLNSRYFIIRNFGSFIQLQIPTSRETKELYISLIESASNQEVKSWLDNQKWHLDLWSEDEINKLNLALQDLPREYLKIEGELNKRLATFSN